MSEKKDTHPLNRDTVSHQLDQAFLWLRKNRKNFHYNDPCWAFFSQWPQQKEALIHKIQRGTYHFGPLTVYPAYKNLGEKDALRFIWGPEESLVQKVMADQLAQALTGVIPKNCVHIKGHGGLKQSVQRVQDTLSQKQFYFRSDIKSFYQSIDHKILMRQLKRVVKHPALLTLIGRLPRPHRSFALR